MGGGVPGTQAPQFNLQQSSPGTGKFGGMANQPGGQQPNYASLFSNFASMFGNNSPTGAPQSSYKPVQSANNFQLRNTYQFNPATDPSRMQADRMQAEADRKAAEANAAKAAADAASQAQPSFTDPGPGGNARGGRISGPNKQIRKALMTAKGVQARAMPAAHGIDNVHTVIDPATVDHPAADIPGIHLRAGRMGKAGGGALAAPGAPAPEEEEDSITAYHGSPHSFEEFDPKYIGTGEGAQAYGHGLYFAKNEDIAKGYRDQLSGDTFLTPENTLWSPKSLQHLNVRVAARRNPEDLEPAIQRGESLLPEAPPETRNLLESDLSMLRSLRDAGGVKRNPGHMYEVRLKARPEHFLDWDKPLSEQRHVIDALSKTKGKIIRDLLSSDLMKNIDEPIKVGDKYIFQMTGRDLMHQLSGSSSGQPNHPKASAALAAAGIRGIRYLDAGSRSQGQGTHNYVVFDPKHIQVARKYEDGGRVGYAGGGGEDDPTVQKALGLTQQAQPTAPQMARRLNDQGLYSHAAEAAAALPQAKGSPQQMKATLKGVKQEELAGFDEAFGGQPSVTRDEMAQHFNDRMPQIETKVLAGEGSDGARFSGEVLPGGTNYREMLLKLPNQDEATKPFQSSHWEDPNVLAHLRMSDRIGPNGEKVLHVEEIQSDWGQKGRQEGFVDPVAHRKHKEAKDKMNAAYKSFNDLVNNFPLPESVLALNAPFRPGEETPRQYERRQEDFQEARLEFLRHTPEWQASRKQYSDARDEFHNLGEPPSSKGVPTGPYVTNTQAWTDLALKAALKEAAHGNYDRVAWTNGQDQAERYDLSKHLDSVHYNPGTQTLYAFDKRGRQVLEEDAEPHEIEKHIGKDLAQKLLADTPDLHSTMNEHDIERDPESGKWNIYLYGEPVHEYGGNLLEFDSKGHARDHLREMVEESLQNHTSVLKNVDLVVGGEGMKSYYDKIVPNRIMDVAKKAGAPVKIEPHKIDTEDGEKTLHSIRMTPELRASVMRGLPAYKDGGRAGYGNGGGEEYKDPQSEVIKDWNWRPLADVQNDLQLTEIPSHVQAFGKFMDETAAKASGKGLTPRDLIKAYTITRSSIQRQAVDSNRVRAAGLALPDDVTGKIRPEGAFGEWLHSDMGQKYLRAAERGEVDPEAVRHAVQVMAPFGKHEKDIPDALIWAAKNLPGREKYISDLVARGRDMASTPEEWRGMTKDVRGIGPSKSGFVASLLGRGDQPTLDARQVILHTGRPTKEASPMIAKKGGKGGVEAVDRLAARQEAMGLTSPELLKPYYQHLAHHAVWDKAGNEETTHEDVMNAMRHAATGGAITAHPLVDAMRAAGLPGLGRVKRGGLRDGGSPDDDRYREYMKRILSPSNPDLLELARQVNEGYKVGDYDYSGFKAHPILPSAVKTTIGPLGNATPKEATPLTWEQFSKIGKGGTLFTLGGDRSNLGRITHISGKKLAWPVDLHAGTKYQQEPNSGVVWANDKSAAKALRSNILRASQKGPVYGAFAPMGPQSVDSSKNMIDVLMSQIAAGKVDKNAAKEFDDLLREGTHVHRIASTDKEKKRFAAAEKMQEWPGILSKEKARDFAVSKMTGTERAALVKLMDAKKWLQAGFPSISATRAAITDPDIMHVSGNMMGGNIVELDPRRVAQDELAFEHSTYNTPTAGKLIGRVPFVERHAATPDFTQAQVTADYSTKAGDPLLIHPYSPNPGGRAAYRGNTEMRQAIQPINNRMLESIQEREEQKKLYGFKSGGIVDKALQLTRKARK